MSITLERDRHDIVTMVFDMADRKANVLNAQLLGPMIADIWGTTPE